MENVQPVVRGCGTRKKGGCYAELPVGEHGSPLETFLLDPVWRMSPERLQAFGIGSINQVLLEAAERNIIFDTVGAGYYPNPTDWLEEVRLFGMSNRITLPPSQLAKVDKETRIVFIHKYAAIQPYEHTKELMQRKEISLADEYTFDHCPFNRLDHYHFPEGKKPKEPWTFWDCAGWMWKSVTPTSKKDEVEGLWILRAMPSFKYTAIIAPKGLTYEPAAFISLPIARLVVINDPEDGRKTNKMLDHARKSTLPVELVEE